MELGEHTRSHLGTTTTWLAHRGQNLQVAHVVLDNLDSVEPVAVVDPLTEELNWWLSEELFSLGHVQVIDEADSLELGALRLEAVLGTSIELGLNDLLHTVGGGTSREVDGEADLILVQFEQNLINKNGLTNTSVTQKQDGLVRVEESLSKESVPDGINSGNDDLVELLVDWLVSWWLPSSPVLLLSADVVLVDSVAVREHRLNVTKDVIDLAAGLFINSGTNGPDDAEHEPLFNVEEEVATVLLLTLLKARDEGVE